MITSVGERKMLFKVRKLLRDSKGEANGSLSYKINKGSKLSGANQHEMNVKCDQSRVKRSSASKLSQRKKKIKLGGFVAFGDDYHFPKQHPPRHN